MYTVVNSQKHDDTTVYAVMSGTGQIEVVSEADLKLLAIVGLSMKTMAGDIVKVDGGQLICDVEEFVPMPEEGEDEYDVFEDYDMGEEDEELAGSDEEDDHSDEDPYDVYEGLDTGEDHLSGGYDNSDEDDIYAGYSMIEDDDEIAEASVVSKLYQLLTPDQVTVLRRYYLWYSQRLFSDAQKGGLTGFKSKPAAIRKQNALKTLKGNGDYRYAGFLDTGSRYAGYTCSLGHPLRFMHLAWDITVGDIDIAFFGQDYNADYEAVINSNNCIAFGIKCIGDFFEVDEECIRSLQRAQNASLKDMALLYDIYQTQSIQQVNSSFQLLDSVLKITDKYDMKRKMLQDVEPVIPFGVAAFYHQFRSVGMPPPKSLIQEIRSCLVGWTNGKRFFNNKWVGELKIPNPSFYERLKVIAKSRNVGVVEKLSRHNHVLRELYKELHGFDAFLVYVYLMFTYELCGFYKYTPTKEGFHDEGGYSKATVGRQMSCLTRSSLHTKFDGLGFDLDSLMRLFEFVKLCQEIGDKYSGSSVSFKLPYFSTSGYKVYEEALVPLNQYGSNSSLKRMLRDYAGGNEAEVTRIYNLAQFMTDSIIGKRDVVRSAVSNNGSMLMKECQVKRGIFDLQKVCDMLLAKTTEFDDTFGKLRAWAEAKAEADEKAYLDAQEAKRLEKEAKKAAEGTASEGDLPDAQTMDRSGLVEYLDKVGVAGVTDPKFNFHKKVLVTVVQSGKAPSDKQFHYLKALYEEVSGTAYAGPDKTPERVDLGSRIDIQDAIGWIQYYPVRARAIAKEVGVADFDKLCSILESIKKYGKISDRQMKWAEMALAIAAKGNV